MLETIAILIAMVVFGVLSMTAATIVSIVFIIVGGVIGLPLRRFERLGKLEPLNDFGLKFLKAGGFVIVGIITVKALQWAVPAVAIQLGIALVVVGIVLTIVGAIGQNNNRARGICQQAK